ncbi:heterokaryon incompatibility protein-domain-containing protein [Zychaea mexicana]|uniref:heterokaryon incompatibility protein-domain-containing protein n=1 Tax=Zychaea mexicana TaxID=64656 RepID=UPI0022FF3690|nr:heterokaryon incompatibility protein-domain-containing protein [Zychaea mexicana]KAI9489913.1 heterokaryon incompatibility protein-domain-containing protein [Zychaea mexicana]
MYIKYCRDQREADPVNTTHYRLNATGGNYRPTYLIRTADWKRVPGAEAKNGYCTLSYCWEQSGRIVRKANGEYECIDNGFHQIVQTVRKHSSTGFWCRKKKVIKQVTYECLLQQLCKDFQIDYLWYDKICIDQSNKQAKYKELKQMYLIYGNARYTVALVPEMKIHHLRDFKNDSNVVAGTNARDWALDDICYSLWFKRSWTLEEVMMSRRILVVGTDVTFWQHSLYSKIPTTYDILSGDLLDFNNRKHKSANQALSEAHFRTSTRQHDKVFVLANIFPDMFDRMEISYDIDPQTMFHTFYQNIIASDLSLLCFGSILDVSKTPTNKSTMLDHNLPSWTGIGGLHVPYHMTTATSFQAPYMVDDNMHLHIVSTYCTLPIEQYDNSSDPDEIDAQMDAVHDALFKGQAVDRNKADEDTILLEMRCDMDAFANCQATHYHRGNPFANSRPLSLTVEDCKECIILPILFTNKYAIIRAHDGAIRTARVTGYKYSYFMPVFKKCSGRSGHYKGIGIYFYGERPDYDDPNVILEAIVKDMVSYGSEEFIIE